MDPDLPARRLPVRPYSVMAGLALGVFAGVVVAHGDLERGARPASASRPATAAVTPANDCDRYASDPLDPHGAGIGALETEADIARAVAACEAELRKAPASPRLLYQSSRAYDAAGQAARALERLRQASDRGYPAAQALLGEHYLEGDAVPQDDAQAARLFRAAAERGIGSAQLHLAGMYIDGRGVAQSDVTGLALLHQSADGGYAEAQALLGQLYLDGGVSFVNDELVAQDRARATHYLKLAAEQGHPEAADLLEAMARPAR